MTRSMVVCLDGTDTFGGSLPRAHRTYVRRASINWCYNIHLYFAMSSSSSFIWCGNAKVHTNSPLNRRKNEMIRFGVCDMYLANGVDDVQRVTDWTWRGEKKQQRKIPHIGNYIVTQNGDDFGGDVDDAWVSGASEREKQNKSAHNGEMWNRSLVVDDIMLSGWHAFRPISWITE